ncbi:MAG TPA: WecB/TagA/CpsF family glycosyltransferase [Acidocella sp.]|jgi:exopolysaccharide biosynthesis WecB/TagA/CpsF family protein|nr:WecB/TagA/CpsF family glycosyltransferase [Acidocella sp.]
MDTLKPATIRLLDVDFDNRSLEEIVETLLARPQQARFAYVVTPNANHIERLSRLPSLKAAYRGAMFCLLDSQVIGLCADLLGLLRPQVVTGADLTAALLARLDGRRVAVLGMTAKTLASLQARYPGIRFLHHQPPMGLLHNLPAFRRARDFIYGQQADFIFFAVGSPVQELLAYAIATRRDATGIGLCVGGALDYCAGTRRRAPPWMRRRGLEWLYRLIQQPRRLARRYLIEDPKVLLFLAIEAYRQRAR